MTATCRRSLRIASTTSRKRAGRRRESRNASTGGGRSGTTRRGEVVAPFFMGLYGVCNTGGENEVTSEGRAVSSAGRPRRAATRWDLPEGRGASRGRRRRLGRGTPHALPDPRRLGPDGPR